VPAASVKNGLNPLAGLTQAHYIKGGYGKGTVPYHYLYFQFKEFYPFRYLLQYIFRRHVSRYTVLGINWHSVF
jgi:hypothetical protein